MAKKDDVKAELTKLGIQFDDSMSLKDLTALLPVGNTVASEPDDESNVSPDEIQVGDPQLLRPIELPLVITPPANWGGQWKNKEQGQYASTLNVAAYAFPGNWKRVKDVEIARLKEIGENPEKYYEYTGTSRTPENGQVSYKNKLME
ncbi:MAG: hypothetical protein KGL39_37910 [Patescibacteria group bacterium]|nr:hypothetical protein [Patescibacteria group bacterium]